MATDTVPETVFLRHAGSELVEHDWPLEPNLAEQLAKGMVRQASEPGPATWHRPEGADAGAVPEREMTPPEVSMPHRSAKVADWQGYAVKAHGLDPEQAADMTKQDLIDRFGS